MGHCVGTQIRQERAIHSTDFALQMGEAMGMLSVQVPCKQDCWAGHTASCVFWLYFLVK